MTTFFAWPRYRYEWDLDIADLHLDGAETPDLVDDTHLRVRLDETAWEDLTLRIEARTGQANLAGVDDLHAVALVSSPRSQLRLPIPLSADGDVWSETVHLDRGSLAGKVELRVELIGRVDGRLRSVGHSHTWDLVVDPSDAPTPAGVPPFDTQWVDFADVEAAPMAARRVPTVHAVMDFSQPTPRLLLNAGLDGFQSLMHADRAKLERRRLRDVLGSGIARYSLSTLMRAAAAQIDADEDSEPVGPSDPLLAQVCAAVAGSMFTVTDVQELYRRIADRSPTLQLELWTEIDSVVDQLTRHSETLSEACKQVKTYG